MQDFLHTIAELLEQTPSAPPPALQEDEFLRKYQLRLESKLQQKDAQISPAEQLLKNASRIEKTGFESSLQQALSDRQTIRVELEHVQEILQGRSLNQ